MTDAYISAACRCVPPDNKPAPDELAACRPFLAAEIALLHDIQVVVALGRIAFDAVLRVYADRAQPVLPQPRFAHDALLRWATVCRCW